MMPCILFDFSCVRPAGQIVYADYLLEGEKRQEFSKIIEYWRATIYPRCLRDSGLRMSCAECTSIFMVVRISIDHNGRMSGYSKTRENACGQEIPEKLERCFMEYLGSIIFPSCLRHMTIETRLGTGLKC